MPLIKSIKAFGHDGNFYIKLQEFFYQKGNFFLILRDSEKIRYSYQKKIIIMIKQLDLAALRQDPSLVLHQWWHQIRRRGFRIWPQPCHSLKNKIIGRHGGWQLRAAESQIWPYMASWSPLYFFNFFKKLN